MATEKLETFAVRILERMGNWEQWAATREKYRKALKRAARKGQQEERKMQEQRKSMEQQLAEFLTRDRKEALEAIAEETGYTADELKPLWQEWLDTQYGEKSVTAIARDFVGVALEHDL